MNILNDLECRTKRLETLLLPERDYLPDIYDAVVEMDMVTACLSRDEAEAKYGSKSDWLNDQRTD